MKNMSAVDFKLLCELYDSRVKAIRLIKGELLQSLMVNQESDYVWTDVGGESYRSWVLCDNEGTLPPYMAIVVLVDERIFLVRQSFDDNNGWVAVQEISLRYSSNNIRVVDPGYLNEFGGFSAPESKDGTIG